VKSGEKTIVYKYSFMGNAPKGLKPPRPFLEQPKNGNIALKKSRSGNATVYEYIYTPRSGFKGRDVAIGGIQMQMISDGKRHWVTNKEKLILIVR
jgi:hypothetical protein